MSLGAMIRRLLLMACGLPKIVYDLAIWRSFRRIKPEQ
jgi:hypothetical protein